MQRRHYKGFHVALTGNIILVFVLSLTISYDHSISNLVMKVPMFTRPGRDSQLFMLLFAGVLASRIPFIIPGFGVDADAWRVASVAHTIAETGQYTASRLPGYPVQELTYAVLPFKNAAIFNLLTAILSAVCVSSYANFLKSVGLKKYLTASIALAFIPVVYVNSVNSMDYVWALCFAMLAFSAVGSRRPLVAGLALGMATGCRITSAGMVLPMFLMMKRNDVPLRSYGRFAGGFVLSSTISFLPVVLKYGANFFSYSQGNLSCLYILKCCTVDVWGIIGFIAVVVFSVVVFLRLYWRHLFPVFVRDVANQISVLMIVLYTIIFSMAPYDAGYLIPVVPFVILLIVHNSTPRRAFAFCCCLALSSFMFGISTSDMPWSPKRPVASYTATVGGRAIDVNILRGPVIDDHIRRIARDVYVARVIDVLSKTEKKSVLVAGLWFAQLSVQLREPIKDNLGAINSFETGNVIVHDVLTTEMAARYNNSHYSICYLPGQDKNNESVLGFNLKNIGATEIIF